MGHQILNLPSGVLDLMPMLPILFFAVIACLIIVRTIYGHKQAKQRQEALAALCDQRGWRFMPDRDRDHDDQFRHFAAFRRGSGRYAYNSMYGRLEIDGRTFPLKTGDFHYKTQSTNKDGKTSTTHHHFSYLLVDVPFPGTPDLAIRPEGFIDKVSGFFGFDDIDFESKEFSDKFHVKGSDKRFTYDVVHPRMMEFLLATRGPALEIKQGYCCVTRRAAWKPEEFAHYLEWTGMFFDRWPRHVMADPESRGASNDQ